MTCPRIPPDDPETCTTDEMRRFLKIETWGDDVEIDYENSELHMAYPPYKNDDDDDRTEPCPECGEPLHMKNDDGYFYLKCPECGELITE